jgi:hypothetical protein
MMRLFGNKRRERTIYFPWERRGIGRALQLPRRQTTVTVLLALLLVAVFLMHQRNKQQRLVRITRANLERTRTALDAYRADHAGRCPKDLGELAAPPDHAAYLSSLPVDGWKRPLHFVCPSRTPSRPYDLTSNGPDGEAQGLDRLE